MHYRISVADLQALLEQENTKIVYYEQNSNIQVTYDSYKDIILLDYNLVEASGRM